MTGLLDGILLDICLRILRLRFRIACVIVEDGPKSCPGSRSGLRGGHTTCGGAEVTARALRSMANDLETQAEATILITQAERGTLGS